MGDQAFPIDPRDLAWNALDEADPQGLCVSGISAGGGGMAFLRDDQWLLGDVFLKT